MAVTKKFLDFPGLTRYDENIKNHIKGITGELNNLETTSKSNLVSAINETNSIAKGANVALTADSYSSLINTFLSLGKDIYKVGQSIYIKTVDVPDVWISNVSTTSSTYTYTTDEQVIEDIDNGTFKVGYYTFSKLETEKIDLTDYVTNDELSEITERIEIVTSSALNDLNQKIIDNKENIEIITSSALNDLNQKIIDNEELAARTIEDIENKRKQSEETIESVISDLGNDISQLEENKADRGEINPTLIEISYNALKILRDNSNLIPGQWYRITDYITTTTQENTQSAGHAFDIIVLATDTNTLNENARAIRHNGDTYFANSNLAAWELKYSLDNDTNRFMWADDADGKGVIYYMKDEFGNECYYDFKNIMFERWLGTDVTATTAVTSDVVDAMSEVFVDHYHSYQSSNLSLFNGNLTVVVDSSDSKFFYTFSLCSADGESFESNDNEEVYDGSLKGYGDNMYTNNMIGEYIPFDEGYGHKLNNIVFKPIDDNADDCGNNVFGKNCNDMTLGFSWTVNNSFGNDCGGNSFGNGLYSNSFGNNCNSNSFGNGCNNNSFGNNNYRNSFGNSCGYNSFGNSCNNNSFGNECNYNSFGNSCESNSFGNYCNYNSFGNYCNYNSFGNSCGSNSFGNECQHIHFLKDYTWYIIVENGNEYIDVTSTQSTSSSSKLRNFTITQGVNTDGTSSTKKTISHDTVNDIFKTTYQPTNSQIISV